MSKNDKDIKDLAILMSKAKDEEMRNFLYILRLKFIMGEFIT